VHELSLAGAVIDTAERHAGGRRVVLIQLRLGELRQVVPDSLSFYFEHVARGTLCEGAALEYETVPATLGCARCGATWTLAATLGSTSATLGSGSATWGQTPPGGVRPQVAEVRPQVAFRCQRCGSADVAVESGDEFEVESIEVEEPACTG
jgi:hydrogenase nickel incorporation protein HypA/HybF